MPINGKKSKDKMYIAKEIIDNMPPLRVLGYIEEDGQWAAHCLETDIVGFGKTFKDAVKNLEELTLMQISFAIFKEDPSLIYRPADHSLFMAFEREQQDQIIHFSRRKPSKTKRNTKVGVFSFPVPSKKDNFCLATP